ncbi:glycosyltransferase [Pseudolysinimonas sp.]|uniref:glycosyltransferase n=1 Tax=Pseudolysinimonas sp. TaxID=2680009 RepID=UPI003F802B42
MTDSDRPGAPALEVVVPVHDEAATLERSIRVLHRFLEASLDETWRITIADNASTDATPAVTDRLAAELPGVEALHLDEKGRGRALKRAWLGSDADVVAYLDVDLSTDLRALPPLIAPLLSGHSDVAIGTRLARASRVVRGPKRELISRSYNFLLHRALGVTFTDAQCGFKAMRADVARSVLPHVEDTGWFFDTELLVIAERAGLRIHEVPVDWVDDEDSSVDVAKTAAADLRGMVRVGAAIATGRIPLERIYAELGRHPLESPRRPSFVGQVVRFAAIGAVSTVAYALLYLLVAPLLPAQIANFAALLLTAIANTAANRRFTFGVRGRTGAALHQVQGLLVFLLAWGITSGSLLLLHLVHPSAGHTAQLVVLTAANLVATLVRFILLRLWVFRRQRRRPGDEPPARHETTTREDLLRETPIPFEKASA